MTTRASSRVRRMASVRRRLGHVGLCVLVAVMATPARAAVPEPETYRLSDYKAETPATLKGAEVVDTARARKLHDAGRTVFIDALPKPPRPKLPEGTVYNEKPRDDIPGSTWLPDVGYGELNPQMEGWFRDELKRLTMGDQTKPVLFYCLSKCWMSWNAAKRALTYGYSHVIWYPEGTDGWSGAGLPLERRNPEKRPFEN